MIVHVGGKRTHGRYLLLRQRVEVGVLWAIGLDAYLSAGPLKFNTHLPFFCSFQGINLVLVKSWPCKPRIQLSLEGNRISCLNQQWRRNCKTTRSLQLLMVTWMIMTRWTLQWLISMPGHNGFMGKLQMPRYACDCYSSPSLYSCWQDSWIWGNVWMSL